MTLDEKIGFFFGEPTENVQGGKNSVLYLLRREIQDCFIGTVVPEDQVVERSRQEKHRLFATLLVIFAGIDLLSKCYAGDDKTGDVRKRLADFTKRYLFHERRDPELYADVFYIGCRNPLVHSFNMHNTKFVLTVLTNPDMANGGLWHVQGSANQFVLVIEGLFNDFVKGCRAYEKDLQTDAALRANFEKMFESYGTLNMFSVGLEPVK